MVKVKNKKRSLSEHVHTKKETFGKKSLNPFEVHINKEKLKVLGKKAKNDRGLPGVSRAKALKKRERTLLPQFCEQNKSNKFTDKRIGERNYNLTEDDKNIARYTAVRVKQHKKSIFNLADDEILTHRGQTLSEIEKFDDDPRSDVDDDEDDFSGNKSGKLERGFVEDAHFGGGLFKKGDGVKSHKDLIDQLIAESKKRKAEKQKQKEATLELTEKLDAEWKDLLPLVNKLKRTDEDVVKAPVDDYDKAVRELKFEARGTPSDKLKTEDEIAKEEKEKLETLERERLERMHGGKINDKAVNTHRSADDLDDDFVFDSDGEDITLAYGDDGKSNVHFDNVANGNDEVEENEDDSEEEELETDSEDNLSDLKDSDDESEDEEGKQDDKSEEVNQDEVKDEEVIEDEEAAEMEDESEVNDESEVDNESGVDEEAEEVEKEVEVDQAISNNKRKLKSDINIETKKVKLDPESIKEDLLLRKEMMEKARNELPYTYTLPEKYESLYDTLKDKSHIHHSVIIERMIKCNHPSLKEGNKDSLGLLFVYLLQYISDVTSERETSDSYKIFLALAPHLFDLAQLNKENANNALSEVIKEKHEDFKGKQREFPTIDVLFYLKLVSCLFSTSDFRHHVVTPSFTFIEQMLTKCKVKTRSDVAYGLFLTTLVCEFTTLSKRYLPASINYLNGILHMAIPKTSVRLIKVLPPFKSTSSNLVLTSTLTKQLDLRLNLNDLSAKETFDDEFRIKTVYLATELLNKFYLNHQELTAAVEIFQPTIDYLKQIPLHRYPANVSSKLTNFVRTLEEFKKNHEIEFIVMEKKRPKALRLYEPNVIKIYDSKQHKVQGKEKAERDKLMHKIKMERKGALREIRRDKAYLGRIKIDRKIQSDQERRQKVNKIMSEAAYQQGELNTIDRKNKKK